MSGEEELPETIYEPGIMDDLDVNIRTRYETPLKTLESNYKSKLGTIEAKLRDYRDELTERGNQFNSDVNEIFQEYTPSLDEFQAKISDIESQRNERKKLLDESITRIGLTRGEEQFFTYMERLISPERIRRIQEEKRRVLISLGVNPANITDDDIRVETIGLEEDPQYTVFVDKRNMRTRFRELCDRDMEELDIQIFDTRLGISMKIHERDNKIRELEEEFKSSERDKNSEIREMEKQRERHKTELQRRKDLLRRYVDEEAGLKAAQRDFEEEVNEYLPSVWRELFGVDNEPVYTVEEAKEFKKILLRNYRSQFIVVASAIPRQEKKVKIAEEAAKVSEEFEEKENILEGYRRELENLRSRKELIKNTYETNKITFNDYLVRIGQITGKQRKIKEKEEQIEKLYEKVFRPL